MIYITFTSATIEVDLDGDPTRLATFETLEYRHSMSLVQRHNEGILETIQPDVRARNSGGQVACQYSITESGDYVIVSGLRENFQSRTFHLHLDMVEPYQMELIIEQPSTPAPWIIADQIVYHTNSAPLRYLIDLHLAPTDAEQAQAEVKRQTSWDLIMTETDADA